MSLRVIIITSDTHLILNHREQCLAIGTPDKPTDCISKLLLVSAERLGRIPSDHEAFKEAHTAHLEFIRDIMKFQVDTQRIGTGYIIYWKNEPPVDHCCC